IRSRTRPSLPCPPPLLRRLDCSPPLPHFRITMIMKNFTETRNRTSVDRNERPSSTQATTRRRSSKRWCMPSQIPHICHAERKTQIDLQRNPESESRQRALANTRRSEEDGDGGETLQAVVRWDREVIGSAGRGAAGAAARVGCTHRAAGADRLPLR